MEYKLNESFNIKKDKNICPNIYLDSNIRISVIKANIIRIEYSKTGKFIDEQTKTVLQRDLGKVDFQVSKEAGNLELKTDVVTLFYNFKEFSEENLQIKINKYMSQNATWKYGKDDYQNLLGTARTLDDIDGSCPLEKGLISSGGFSSFDDTNSVLLCENGFIKEKNIDDDYIDVYYFCHEENITNTINDFYKMTGYPLKIDRQYLGNWWSRYWEYDDETLKEVVLNFEKNKIPLAVNIMDMDWHEVPSMKYGYGWTGFTWNKKLFKDPKETLEWQHEKNLLVALNLHPADGFREHEEDYLEIKQKLKTNSKNIQFDVTCEQFMDLYFETFISKNQKIGVDFWWMDWQQGNTSKIKNLDPLFALNHMHFLDALKTQKKPLIFSRFSGLGSHRYPIGFSGDTHMTWKSLNFQPYFTANSANVGYNYWSHDIGGHFHGKMDKNLYLRWLQFGIFSPIMRLHSSKNIMIYKEPWNFDEQTLKICRKYMTLRHELISYINSFNKQTTIDGTQLIRPLYHDEFDNYKSYEYKNSYYFGKDLIVHPITEKINDKINGNLLNTYLPKGIWYDEEGFSYTGNNTITNFYKIDQIPIFYKAGTILVKDGDPFSSHLYTSKDLKLDIFPGTNDYSLVEEHLDFTDESTYKTYVTDDNIQVIEIVTPKQLVNKRFININYKTRFEISKYIVNNKEVNELNNVLITDCKMTVQIQTSKKRMKYSLFDIIKQFDLLSHLKNDIYNNLENKNFYNSIIYINNLHVDRYFKDVLLSEVLKDKYE